MKPFLWYPVGLGLVGGASVPWLAGGSVPAFLVGTTLALVGALAGYRLAALARSLSAQASPPPSTQAASGMNAVWRRSCEVWGRQIDTSRNEANEAVLRLTGLFQGTVGKIETTLAAIRKTLAEIAGDSGVMSTVTQGANELRQAMAALVSMQQRKNATVSSYARDLKEMASQVQAIAMQIRLLSFNAAVEAARAGSAAGGFAVVAGEMRSLATVSGETADGMMKKVEVINATLEDLVGGGGRAMASEVDSLGSAESAIRGVTERFGQVSAVIAESARVMETKTEEVHRDVSDALVVMQFQDRVSQIQEHVVRGLAELGSKLDGTGGALDPREWEGTLTADFSMTEEFDNLHARDAARVRHKEHRTTFF